MSSNNFYEKWQSLKPIDFTVLWALQGFTGSAIFFLYQNKFSFGFIAPIVSVTLFLPRVGIFAKGHHLHSPSRGYIWKRTPPLPLNILTIIRLHKLQFYVFNIVFVLFYESSYDHISSNVQPSMFLFFFCFYLFKSVTPVRFNSFLVYI